MCVCVRACARARARAVQVIYTFVILFVQALLLQVLSLVSVDCLGKFSTTQHMTWTVSVFLYFSSELLNANLIVCFL